MTEQRMVFVGGGNMAEALLKGMLARKLLKAEQVTVCELRPERRQELEHRYRVATSDDPASAVREATTVMLCTKPQQFPEVLAALKPALPTGALVISIAAGVTLATIESSLTEGTRVVRVMPNTPALVQQGMAGYSGGARASDADLAWTRELFTAVGKAVEVPESALHAVTAVSGSGPAYVFYVMEAMLAGATELGLDPATARELVMQTFVGASALASGSDLGPEVLRANVTSKGGTTAAALAAFEQAEVGTGVRLGVLAAAARSRELAGDA